MEMNGGEAIKAPALANWALAHGRGALTSVEIAALLNIPEDQVRRRLHEPARRGEWVTPTHGLWIPVPPEYQTWGAPPGIEIVDAMMRHRKIRYYVGWLSAAQLHGAGHQAPQVFQVAVSRHIRDRTVGRTKFRFMQRDIAHMPVTEHPTTSGSALVSTVEGTMLDLANDIGHAAGIDNAATVILELAMLDSFSVATITQLAPKFPAAAGRRIGWLLQHLGGRNDLEPLNRAIRTAVPTPSRLDPASPNIGPLDHEWMLQVNRDVEEES